MACGRPRPQSPGASPGDRSRMGIRPRRGGAPRLRARAPARHLYLYDELRVPIAECPIARRCLLERGEGVAGEELTDEAAGGGRGHHVSMLPMIVHLIDGTYELFRHFYGIRRFA